MTDKKKFKGRIRARMKQTGERYTEAQVAIKGAETLDRVVDRLIKARKKGVFEVFQELNRFHNEHCMSQNSDHFREWKAQMGSQVLDYLWPKDSQDPNRDLLKEFLVIWATQGPEKSAVLSNPYLLYEAKLQEEQHPTFSQLSDLTPSQDDAEEDATWYEGSFKELGPERLNGMMDEQVLATMWEEAPTVYHIFGIPKPYGWDHSLSSRLQGSGVPSLTKKFLVTEKAASPQDSLAHSLREVARLRQKLQEAGINPDED